MDLLTILWVSLDLIALPCFRRWPRIAAGLLLATSAMCVAQGLSGGDDMPGIESFVALFLPPVVVFFAAREFAAPLGLALGVVVTASTVFNGLVVDPTSYVPELMPGLVALVAGHAVRQHDQVARQLAERAAEVEAERDSYAELSVRYERARIAAELHDIVAHAISVMVVQAGAGQRLAAVDPEATAEALRNIGDAAREAQGDMERLVALLADDREDGSPPDFELVAELVRRARGSGLDVTLRLEGERGGLASEAVRCVYLVVREGLTNALRYASGAAVEVVVAGSSAGLDVRVRNDAAVSPAHTDLGAGTGLRGLRERLGRVGGRVDAGPTSDGGWVLSAAIPRRAPA